MAVRSGLEIGISRAAGTGIAIFLRQPAPAWHAGLASDNTGSLLAANNLPPAALRGSLTQPEKCRWYTRDHLETGGPVGRRADVFLSATGQWAVQTVPQARPGDDLGTRLLFANARGRLRTGAPARRTT